MSRLHLRDSNTGWPNVGPMSLLSSWSWANIGLTYINVWAMTSKLLQCGLVISSENFPSKVVPKTTRACPWGQGLWGIHKVWQTFCLYYCHAVTSIVIFFVLFLFCTVVYQMSVGSAMMWFYRDPHKISINDRSLKFFICVHRQWSI